MQCVIRLIQSRTPQIKREMSYYYQQLVQVLFYLILIMFLRMSYYMSTGLCPGQVDGYKVQLNEDT